MSGKQTGYYELIRRPVSVVGLIDLTGLLPPSAKVSGPDAVLNGIAYDSQGDRLFVTGKNWPTLFEIRLRETGKMAGQRH